MKEIFLKIFGRVQGVGYRRWAEKEARKIGGISGWVRNADDGTVEILMRGDQKAVETMIAACYRGALAARVDRIEFKPSAGSYFLPPVEDGLFERI